MSAGRISTFYSYKGGAGRSFALANVAVLLGRWGHRVLCVDWDMEAPGLDLYFGVQSPASHGLLDFLTAVLREDHLSWQDCVTRDVCSEKSAGSVDLIAAGDGVDHSDYLRKLEALDWDALYSEHDLGGRLETMRAEWCAAYDFILIDSRTGITDPGAICTVQLPDSLFMVLTANRQSLSGIRDVANRAEDARNRLPFERRRLNIVPVLSRFDPTQEYELANEWRTILASELQPFFGTWLNARVPTERALDLCTIPYVSKWSFGEKLAVLTETRRTPYSVSYALENLASLLSLGFDRTDVFGESPDSYVELAKREARRRVPNVEVGGDINVGNLIEGRSAFQFDCFLNYPRDLHDVAMTIGKLMVSKGWRIFLDVDISGGDSWPKKIDDALAGSQFLIALIGQSFGRGRQIEEAYTFLKQVSEERSARAIVPVLVGSAGLESLPSVLANTRFVDGRNLDPEEIAKIIEERLQELSQQSSSESR